MIGVRAAAAGERADAAGGVETVDAGQRHVHQHDVIAARHRGDRFLAGADKVGAVAELGENGVEDDPAIGIVLGAQHRERACRRPRAARGRASPAAAAGDRQNTAEKRNGSRGPVYW